MADEKPKLEFTAFEDTQIHGDWRVEAVNPENGECYIAIFCGSGAEERAVEYAALKNGTHPYILKLKEAARAAKAAPVAQPPIQPSQPTVVQISADQIVVDTVNHGPVLMWPKSRLWKYDKKRDCFTAKRKPSAVIVNVQQGK